ncbi:cysteine synthase [Solibacillus isronensis]|uniref:cysteine synthase n=1 Tax=Solibacillus isronensis TaxID=412383 RepID=UPI0009A85FA7|nr:cysteine synthase [Solibacillus isronensis]
MLSKWLTSLEENGVKVETVIEKTELVEGDILNGSVYVTNLTEDEEDKIDYISLLVLCEELDGELTIVGKHSFQLVGGIRSKDGEIIPFEIIPDERWVCGKDEQLILQTTVVFLDGVAIEEQGVISYSAIE